ncbi:hypothetical protein B0E34_13830 [Chryseobacterium mucoviscidosis]|uniref:Uncharacterized protein n=1 Tax=Chryseobacterium mucoviscidosis TaxID=1945581 RepID=A0A202BYP2_9FLAO|nr:hypothetical protein B0E34_13830 [Chryseobacterium mucoviscidosis]
MVLENYYNNCTTKNLLFLHESLITYCNFHNKKSVFLKQNLFKLISELTAKGTKDHVKANFCNNQSAQKNKNQRF